MTVLRIDRMLRAECSARVREAILAVPGVETADVVWVAGRGGVVVTHEGIPGMIVAAVEDAGFTAREA